MFSLHCSALLHRNGMEIFYYHSFFLGVSSLRQSWLTMKVFLYIFILLVCFGTRINSVRKVVWPEFVIIFLKGLLKTFPIIYGRLCSIIKRFPLWTSCLIWLFRWHKMWVNKSDVFSRKYHLWVTLTDFQPFDKLLICFPLN